MSDARASRAGIGSEHRVAMIGDETRELSVVSLGSVQTRRGSALASAPVQDPADQSSTLAAARTVIAQAVGVVMGRGRCSVTEATERLMLVSRATNRTLGEVAQSILNEATRTRRTA